MSLRFVILALLNKGPNSGYGIGRMLSTQLNHIWEAQLQQIYTELARLLAEGMVEAERIDLLNRPAKKIYTITPAGRGALDEWLVQRPTLHLCKDDLMVKLYCLERVPTEAMVHFLEERLDYYDSRVSELRDKLDQARRARPEHLGHVLTLESALSWAEGQASWCEKAISSVLEEGGEPSRNDNPSGRRKRRTKPRTSGG